ncbi:AAA family ATPase [Streptomyces profundus]|uniref:AAA family ATPase n=1 Tax=Streptomyces profundus TaxID=2867410 RepID=UPI001D16556E|nr:AAA family ATPase [Streptomyces sp. MA3_2.13]UED86123.1 AAA family ATPase [Streptomyces sp. MA3_2.13]
MSESERGESALRGAVVVIAGVMAAGKSTVAQALAERLPAAAHVRGDTFRRMIVSGRVEPDPSAGPEAEAQLRLRYRLSAAVADGYAEAGVTAVVQDVVLGDDLSYLVGQVRSRPLYVVVLAPSPAAVAAREAARAKTAYAENGGWTVAALDGWLRERTPRIGRWLDTSSLDPAGTVDAILADLPTARVA